MSDTFYDEIQCFSDFSDTFEDHVYFDLPHDWWIIVCDIKGSTKAVQSGLYKEVNLIGAACIGVISNIGDYPYVFGGDGASFAIPNSLIGKVTEELIKVKNTSCNRFSLDLRVGAIMVSELKKLSANVKVAKFELSKGKSIAKFSGGGLAKADSLIKNNEKYLLVSNSVEECGFDNLSCRWEPVNNQNGLILTLIVYSSEFSKYKYIYTEINKILDFNSENLNPIKDKAMEYKGLFKMLKEEFKFEEKIFSLVSLKRFFEIVICYLFFNLFPKFGPESFKHYSNSIKKYSDFKKFDDTLRFVVDCTEEQKNDIVQFLDSQRDLNYGITCSSSALMTCLVHSIDDGNHIHFVDGADGGYTSAAKSMKESSLVY